MKGIIEKLGITPGPWIAVTHNDGFERIGPVSVDWDGWVDDVWIDIDEPDKKLIAAAPEMLEALISMCIDFETYGNCWSEALSIIESATGKTWEEIKELL